MKIDVVPATESYHQVLANLYQLYIYDFTSFKAWDVEADGKFQDHSLEGCFDQTDRHPFFFYVDDKLAGFAIVDRRTSLTGSRTVWDVADFFVLRKYRNHGVGEHAARAIFGYFRGSWEVRVMAGNLSAAGFWRTVVKRYAVSQSEEVQWHDEHWQGPVYFFDNHADFLSSGETSNLDSHNQ